ncbi:MAG: 30S ribosomal protein S1 [Clostridia bacterium]|nr:30S ribosomal protein S1 [Clostridia bacterium]
MTKERYLPEGERLHTIKNTEYISSLSGLEKAMIRGEILEAVALVCTGELSVTVDLGGIKGIIPREEVLLPVGTGEIKDIAIITRVGKPVCFKVTEITEDGQGRPVALLSRREAQRECLREYVMQLIPGDVIPARVTHMEHFGAFVDVGCGIVSLLSIDSISVSRISHPRDRFEVGQRIYTVVREIDYATGRMYVSHKELLGTWEENAARIKCGTTVTGVIRSVESYGIFIELAPNLAGLAEYAEGYSAGRGASVYIKSLIPDKMKIKLVLIDVFGVPERCPPLDYFIDGGTTKHISRWRYSPPNCRKLIESVFE